LWSAEADLRFYTHEIVIENTGEEGELSVCPLYGDKEVAITARWDDNNPKHYRMQELMQEHGIKGTYFLNYREDRPPMDHEKLKALNADLGAHSMTHARLASEVSINQMFWEVAEIRAILEAEGDQPVNSYCFADGNYRNENRRFMQGLIAESLQRSGYTHSMSQRFAKGVGDEMDPVTSVNSCGVNDRNPSLEKVDARMAELEASTEWKETEPCISFGVHVWMSNSKHWEAMDQIYQRYGGRDEWWYCTQTEYAAYRKMIQQYELSGPEVTADGVRYTLRVPYAADIGADVPLTLRFSDPTARALVDGQPAVIEEDEDGIVFSVAPPLSARIPQVISYQPGVDSLSYYETGKIDTALEASLELEGDSTLVLRYSIASDVVVEDLRVRYILPLKYETPSPEALPAVSGDAEAVFRKELEIIESGEYLYGNPFLLCQIDYLANGRPERVFTSLFEETVVPPQTEGHRDNSFISGLFTDRSIWDRSVAMSAVGAEKDPELTWYGAGEDERLIFNERVADVGERLKDELKSQPEGDCYFMIVTDFVSPRDGLLKGRHLSKSSEIYLNGVRLHPGEGDPIRVDKGINRLMVLGTVGKRTDRLHHQFKYVIRGE
tara:strand:+ start:9803 stop:11629 length:1827 start_codon:yes stop_codon:yes gene_type:complete